VSIGVPVLSEVWRERFWQQEELDDISSGSNIFFNPAMAASSFPKADLVLVVKRRFLDIFWHVFESHALDMTPPSPGIQEEEVAKGFFPPWAPNNDKLEVEAS
jgi:hypothetical protein